MADGLEERVAYLEERLDETAGRLNAALELLDLTTQATFAAAEPMFWSDTFEDFVDRAPPGADRAYIDAYRSILHRVLVERFRPGDARTASRVPSVSLRADAIEAVVVELVYDLYRLTPGGSSLLPVQLRRCAEDVLPSSGVANIQFSDWVARILMRLEDKLEGRKG